VRVPSASLKTVNTATASKWRTSAMLIMERPIIDQEILLKTSALG